MHTHNSYYVYSQKTSKSSTSTKKRKKSTHGEITRPSDDFFSFSSLGCIYIYLSLFFPRENFFFLLAKKFFFPPCQGVNSE